MVRGRRWSYLLTATYILFGMIIYILDLPVVLCLGNITVSVECDRGDSMRVLVHTPGYKPGRVYVKGWLNSMGCSTEGTLDISILNIPFNSCGTLRYETSYESVFVVQHHNSIVTLSDVAYRVQCFYQTGQHTVLSLDTQFSVSDIETKDVNGTADPPKISMNIYDFNEDVFVREVKLGDIYELEIDIANGDVYGGFVRNCIAKGISGMHYTLIDSNGCPTDPSVMDQVYADDLSKVTGHLYLYMPFEVFKFAQTPAVVFQCSVVICNGHCQPFLCGNSQDETGTFGRRRRRSLAVVPSLATPIIDSGVVVEEFSMVREIIVVENNTSNLTQSSNTQEQVGEEDYFTTHIPWMIVTAVLSALLALSSLTNVCMLGKLKRRKNFIRSTRHRAECEIPCSRCASPTSTSSSSSLCIPIPSSGPPDEVSVSTAPSTYTTFGRRSPTNRRSNLEFEVYRLQDLQGINRWVRWVAEILY